MAGLPDLDYNTVQLIHEAALALGPIPTLAPVLPALEAHRRATGLDLTETKFPSLKERLVADLRRDQISQFLRELRAQLPRPAAMTVGGSVALTLQDFPRKPTDDIDVVDEIPLEIRSRSELTNQLARSYGINLAHVQSQSLPSGWDHRLHSLGSYGQLQVSVVDAYDILAGKVYSARTKDRDHLRRVAVVVGKDKLRLRLQSSTQRFWSDETRRKQAVLNWYVIYGEDLDLTPA